MTNKSLRTLALLVLAVVSRVEASVPNFTPWQNIDLYYGSAVRDGAILPVTASGPAWEGKPWSGAVVMLGADNGGTSRSLNMGRSFETANGGRGFGDSVCGGYSAADFMTTVKPDCTSTLPYPVLYGGPPAATSAFEGRDSYVHALASGAWPAGMNATNQPQVGLTPTGTAGLADGLVYRASNHLYVSPDAAASWFPLSPQCSLNQLAPGISSVAVDRGRGGHVVVASSNTNDAFLWISGCLPMVDESGVVVT